MGLFHSHEPGSSGVKEFSGSRDIFLRDISIDIVGKHMKIEGTYPASAALLYEPVHRIEVRGLSVTTSPVAAHLLNISFFLNFFSKDAGNALCPTWAL